MQKKYAGQGLVCMSVTFDQAKDAGQALAFLRKQNATFENYLLDERDAVKEEKLGTAALPAAIVVGKDGQRVKLFTPDDDFDYQAIEAVVAPLLN